MRSPINGAAIAEVKLHSKADADCAIQAANAAFRMWQAEQPRTFAPALSRPELARLALWRLSFMMTKISYTGYRFPPVIIQQADSL